MSELHRQGLDRHPSVGGVARGERSDADVVDFATERAIRLLVRAGLVAPSQAARRKGPVR